MDPETEKKSYQVTNESTHQSFDIPAGQEWLSVLMDKQLNQLNAIRKMMVFFTLLLILSLIFTGCSALGLI